jgi:membrane-bound ClpP family serine protease
MIEWVLVLSLLAIGLATLVIEIIFVPGTTVVGVVGFAFMAIGISLGFYYFGETTGWITLAGTAVVSSVVIYYSFKSDLWRKFALKTSIDSKFNEGLTASVTEGQLGIAVSALRPVGKAELGNQVFEVKTLGDYLEVGSPIKVTKVLANQIIVELTT